MQLGLAVLFFLGFSTMADGLKCIKCINCTRYEESQSVTCQQSTRCMKLHLQSGQINRECGTEQMCTDKEARKNTYSSVHCCDSDNCNSSAQTKSTVMAVAALLAISTFLNL